ncbi:MAG: TIGR03986 family CRISPR-associated RAMP protein [Deltaproteobacteria bacterium]|nr:TIGR03986 family CRISPR-associated RAMP protein [Deltaproteobacteria bacterium]
MSELDKIRAPYGFVPLSEHIYFPDWGPAATQDVPFRDGVCGWIDVEIEALSPIFVRDASSKSDFFRTPDGKFAIPGSSLRGLIRNVVEIATFGRMGRVNDHRYGVRDLANNELYGRHMARIEKGAPGFGGRPGPGRPVPLVNAGWMRKAKPEDGEGIAAVIEAVDFAKLEYRKLLDLARARGVTGFQPGDRQSSVRKYKAWDKELTIRPRIKPIERSGAYPSSYGEVDSTSEGTDEWQLVFTGQPNRWNPSDPPRKGRGAGNPKHHDFAFRQKRNGRTFMIPQARKGDEDRATFEDFEFIHADRGQQNRADESPNEEWKYWKARFGAGKDVPVFFLEEAGVAKSFGLAMMFRLAFRRTTRDAVRNRQRDLELHSLDFGEAMFGRVRSDRRAKGEESGEAALKGRVSFETCVALGDPKPQGQVEVVLGGPKASYYPNYIEQDVNHPGSPPRRVGGKPDYRTLMDTDAVVRGWKRYRPLTKVIDPPRPTKGSGAPMDLGKVGSVFRPLPAGTKFVGRIHCHNLKTAELGALLWALSLGEASPADPKKACRHMVGLGRPLGYGSARISIKSSDLRRNENWSKLDESGLAGCGAAFADVMEKWARDHGIAGGWAASRAIFELQELARPFDAADGRHMQINHPDWKNEFQQAKLLGLALASAGDDAEWRAAVKRAGFEGSGAQLPPGAATKAQRGASSGSASTSLKVWPGMKGGSLLKVRLTGKTKKGKWTCDAVEFKAKGAISFGEAPTEAKEGDEREVIVQAGGDASNLGLKWP